MTHLLKCKNSHSNPLFLNNYSIPSPSRFTHLNKELRLTHYITPYKQDTYTYIEITTNRCLFKNKQANKTYSNYSLGYIHQNLSENILNSL